MSDRLTKLEAAKIEYADAEIRLADAQKMYATATKGAGREALDRLRDDSNTKWELLRNALHAATKGETK